MRKPAYTAKDREDAWFKAEQKLTRKNRPNTEPALITLAPSQIRTRPELFQPREFSYGFREVDREHVKKLIRALESANELDPILVIKLKGVGWVCVDGHHRLAAYIKANKPEITCEWFGGSVREAVDESMRRNKKDRLSVPLEDKLEEAWKRVVLGWGTKRDIAELCGVSERTVGYMRATLKVAQSSDLEGELFRERLRAGDYSIDETSWAQVKLVYAGVSKKEITSETLSARLAKRIRSRLGDFLLRDPKITARALEIHDPELPQKLIEEWQDNTGRAQEHQP